VTVTEVLNGLGSWSVGFSDALPDEIAQALQFFGHVAIVDGTVNVDLTGDALLTSARYVGVLKSRDLATGRTIGGDSMEQWLGDEDDKGAVFETAIVKTNGTLGQWLASILPAAVHLGIVHDPGGTWSGKVQWVSPRKALQTVCDAFGVTYRVNGNGTVDVGTAAQLYRTVPRTNDVDPIIVRAGAGVDLDVAALGGTPDVADDARDFSDRIVLVGQTQDDGTFAVGSQSMTGNPYVDLFGNAVRRTRLISETGTETGSVAARAQLALNRFARIVRSLTITSDDYLITGDVRVGDTVWIYDPDAGIFSASNEITFRGEVLHPDKIGVTGLTWPVVEGMTVAYRAPGGTWYDLTPFVTYETGTLEITVGDLPRSLTSASSNPVVDRQDSAPDTVAPNAPTGLALSSTSFLNSKGGNSATISASWTAPALNVDGSVFADFAYYVVLYRVHARPQWQITYSSLTTVDIPAVIDTDYDVQVAAVDKDGNTGAFSPVVAIHTSVDTTAPNAPADPAVGSYLGQLRITYAGTDNLGQPMPADAQRIDVEVASVVGGPFTVVSQLDPRVPGKAYVDAPYGSTRYVRLRAYDNAQNGSAYSAVISGATVQAGDGDIASMNVGKLIAGTIGVDVVIATRLTTALTGQRAEHNAAGFQVWNATGTKVVDLNGSANLLTGTLQTDLAGARRIVIGAAGLAGEIDFYAPDGTQALIRAYTESTGLEAMQFGVKVTTTSDAFWNRINYNNDHNGWSNYRSNRHDFYIGGPNGAGGADTTAWAGQFTINHTSNFGTTATNRLLINGTVYQISDVAGHGRFSINATDTVIWDASGNPRVQATSTHTIIWSGPGSTTGLIGITAGFDAGSSLASPNVVFETPQVGGTGGVWNGALQYAINSDGTNGGLNAFAPSSFDSASGSYIPIKASAFTVSSDRRAKNSITDAKIDALSIVRSMRVMQYRQKPLPAPRRKKEVAAEGGRMALEDAGPVKGWKAPAMPLEIGLIAQDAHELIRRESPDGMLGVSLGQWVALLHKAFVDYVEANERGGKP
jgi:hypothetical protein